MNEYYISYDLLHKEKMICYLSTCAKNTHIWGKTQCGHMNLVHQWPAVCHSLCREDSKGVILLSLRASFDHVYHSAAEKYLQVLQISSSILYMMTGVWVCVCVGVLYLFLLYRALEHTVFFTYSINT